MKAHFASALLAFIFAFAGVVTERDLTTQIAILCAASFICLAIEQNKSKVTINVDKKSPESVEVEAARERKENQ